MIDARFQLTRGSFRLDVAFAVPSEGVTGIFGPSGCGKTTLLRCMAGLGPRPAGFFSIDGAIWQDDARGVFIPPEERGVGLVFQHAALFPHLTVQGNVLYALDRRPEEALSPTLEELAEETGIGPLLDRATSGLSGGERQRVAIARALASAPRMLLMDEPLSALDLDSRSVLLPYLKRLCSTLKIPVIYVTHNAEELSQLASRVVHLEGGKVRAVTESAPAIPSR